MDRFVATLVKKSKTFSISHSQRWTIFTFDDESTITRDIFIGLTDFWKESVEKIPTYNDCLRIKEFDLKFISECTTFVTSDEMRPAMTCINLRAKDGIFSACASDGHILIKNELDIKDDNDTPVGDFDFNLNKICGTILSKIKPKTKKFISIFWDKETIAIDTEDDDFNYTITTRRVSGSYPDFDAVIPKNNPNKIALDKAQLKRIFMIAKSIPKEPMDIPIQVDFEIANSYLKFGPERADTRYGAKINIKRLEGDDTPLIRFNSSNFRRLIDLCRNNDVVLHFSEANRPVIATEEGRILLIMPVIVY